MKKIEKELIKRIKSCVYFKEEHYYKSIDDLDDSESYRINFNLPPIDLNKLVAFCKINELMIEVYAGEIIISLN